MFSSGQGQLEAAQVAGEGAHERGLSALVDWQVKELRQHLETAEASGGGAV